MMRLKTFRVFVLTMIATLALCLAGCGSDNQDNASASSESLAQSTSQVSSTSDGELIIGQWIEDDGSTISFDGTSCILSSNGTSTNVPYTIDESSHKITIHGTGVTTWKYEFVDNDSLSITSTNTPTVLKRTDTVITKGQFDSSDSLELGQTYENDSFELCFQSADIVESFDVTKKGNPNDHFKQDAAEGRRYYLVKADVVSKLNSPFDVANNTKVTITVNGDSEINAKAWVVGGDDLQPLQDEYVYYYCAIAESQASKIETAVLTWDVSNVVDLSNGSVAKYNVKLV